MKIILRLLSSRRLELASQLKQWHLKVIEIVKRGQHRKSLDKLFQGFKPAVESCYFNWEVAYPLEGITYCSTDKKSNPFCWPRAMQFQRGVKAAAGASGEPGDSGGGGRLEGGAMNDFKGRGGHSLQQEVAVRPKETILTKRKGLSLSGGGGMVVRLGGSVSLSLEDGGGKCVYKGAATSSGGKLKLTQGSGKGVSVGGQVGGGGIGSSKHASAKRRTSSEDSSLEPDLAELSLDDGCSLALGAEASNTFEFLPPPPEMLPSPSSLLRDSLKYSSVCDGSKSCETKRASHVAAAPAAAEPAPPRFASEENREVIDILSTAEQEAKMEAEHVHNRDEDVDSGTGHQPSTCTARSSSPQAADKTAQVHGEAAAAAAPAECGAVRLQGAEATGEVSEGEAVGEDDYQAYYLGAASEEGADKQLADSHQVEEPDIFAGIKPLENAGRMEVRIRTQGSQIQQIKATSTNSQPVITGLSANTDTLELYENKEVLSSKIL